MDKHDSTNEDLDRSLREGLEKIASQNRPEDSALLRERRNRRTNALSFGAGLMLIAFNSQGSNDDIQSSPDLFSLGAAALLVALVIVRLIRSLGQPQTKTLSGFGYALMLFAAAVLFAQAYGAL